MRAYSFLDGSRSIAVPECIFFSVADKQAGVTMSLWPQGDQLKALYSSHTIFVKRKAGVLSHAGDPSGGRSLQSRSAPNTCPDLQPPRRPPRAP